MSKESISEGNNCIYVTRPSLPPIEEYIEYLKKIWGNGILTNMGPLYEEFGKKLSRLLETEICLPMCNGHMALEMTLQALGVKGEIITTPYTFASTTHAIVRNGCTPVFCDIREEDCTIDTEKIEDLITDKTVAIIPVHVYGFPCNAEEIERIAKKYNLKVIYDAAHAFGVKIGNKSIAGFGDATMFSFHATKVFQTIEGGCIALKKPELALKIYQLGNFGIMNEEHVDGVGANAKMNEFEAAMGLCNLNHLEENSIKRRRLYEIYVAELSDIPGVRFLKPYRNNVKMNYAYMPIFFEEEIVGKSRDDIYKYLIQKKIYSRKYFYPITSEFDCYKDKGYRAYTPIAQKVSRQVLTLPIYPSLEEDKVRRICNLISKYINKG